MNKKEAKLCCSPNHDCCGILCDACKRCLCDECYRPCIRCTTSYEERQQDGCGYSPKIDLEEEEE